MAALVFLASGAATHCLGATNYVSITGNDTNSGSAAFPWRTVQHAAAMLQPGDTGIVLAGTYGESVTTTRGGTGETSRIVFQATGTATLQSFTIKHPYVTMNGFDITRWSAPSRFTGYVQALSGGDHFQILNNTIRDGISIVRSDLVFTNAPTNTISSATGGFTNAGFQAGMTMYVFKAASATVLSNNVGPYVIQSVTDNAITLAAGPTLANQGPILAYLDASFNYGLVVGANSGLVQGNTFSNLDYRAAFIGGNNDVYESNTFEHCNGWWVMEFAGVTNVIRGNLIRDCPLKQYSQLSPNVFVPSGGIPTHQITFEENFVQDFDGVLGLLTDSTGNSHDLVFRNNVFVNDSGPIITRIPNVSFINNSFSGVATGATAAVQSAAHPLILQSLTGQYSADGAVAKNNVFHNCGDHSTNLALHGWYEIDGLTNYTTDYDFVSGPSPGFAAKTGFSEGHGLNGGNPGFVNTNNPLGPDGIPFTADDGLQLLSNSVLRGAGQGGVDIGAYAAALASFTASPTNGTAPLTVTFVDTSNGTTPLSLDWDLGDASTNTAGGASFVHTYAAGTYTVTLTASNSSGVTTMPQTNLITVLSPFQAWQLQYFGSTNCATCGGDTDFDGDGISNTNEFLAGTNPTNSLSGLRILSVVQQDNDVVITWATAGGRTNIVQVVTGDATGAYTTNFVDISNSIKIPGSGDATTNYVDMGGTTNTPSRFYRVRLVP